MLRLWCICHFIIHYFEKWSNRLNFKCSYLVTAWEVSKCGVISGPYFPVFGLNTKIYGPEIIPYLDTFHAVCIIEYTVWYKKVTRSGLFSTYKLPIFSEFPSNYVKFHPQIRSLKLLESLVVSFIYPSSRWPWNVIYKKSLIKNQS